MKIDFDKIKDLKIVVVGDSMLDVFFYGAVKRISPEAPVPVLKSVSNNYMLGGALNVVANLHSLGAKITLFSVIGDDMSGKKILSMLEKYDNLEAYVMVDKDYQTTTKTRYLSGKQHLMRFDQEETVHLKEHIEQQIIDNLHEACKDADVIIASDYAKGFMTPKIRLALATMQTPAFKIVDTKGNVADYAKGFNLITPNIKELEDYTKTVVNDTSSIGSNVDIFYKNYKFPNILVTASERGMFLYELLDNSKSWRVYSEPAYNKNPVDVSGAGDTVVAALAIAIGLKVDYQYALEFASRCAAISIGKSGTSTVTIEEIKDKYNTLKRDYKDYVNVLSRIREQKSQSRSIGLVNGCFDLLHDGHLTLLKKSKELCQYLIVAINSDTTIKKLKGKDRPINCENTRAELLSSLKFVDEVIIFDEKDPRKIIEMIMPDFIFKGKEYENKKIIEQKLAKDISCDIIYLETNDQSTTKIIAKMKGE